MWVGFASVANADNDGVYARFDSDTTLAIVGGAGVSLDGQSTELTVSAELRARVIDAAGPVVGLRWRSGSGSYLLGGVELRPFFPAFFLLNLDTQSEWLDLFIQSFSVEIGAALFPFDDKDFGVGLAVGLAVELPLLLPSGAPAPVHGLFLRLSARRVDATRSFQATPDSVDRSDWTLTAALSLVFNAQLGAARDPFF